MSWLKQLDREAKDLSINSEFTPKDARLREHLPRTRYHYSRDVGIGLDSNVVMSPVNWITRNFTESDLLMERERDGTWEVMQDDLTDLLKRPNDFYGGTLLWRATLTSFLLDGNSYWLKTRNQFGRVIRLWYIPHFLIEPQTDPQSDEFIDHYEYRPRQGARQELQPRDLVHFRYGLDPEQPQVGKSPVRPLLREVFTDEEASNFSASILRNMGVPGGIIAPAKADAVPGEEEVQEMKDYMKSGFTGDKRGDWLVLGAPTEIEQFGFDPSQLMLTNLRDISEERVCAALGVPAAVVGFGAGLQQTKVGATMKELRRLAWTSCIEPMQTDLSEQLNNQLLPDFRSQLRRFRLRFDSSSVPAFAEEETERTRRITMMVERGVLRVDRAQAMLDLEVDEEQDVYLRPQGAKAITPEGEPDQQPPGGGGEEFPFSPNGDGEEEEGENPVEEAEAASARAQLVLSKLNGG